MRGTILRKAGLSVDDGAKTRRWSAGDVSEYPEPLLAMLEEYRHIPMV